MHYDKSMAAKMPTRLQTAANYEQQYNPDTMTDKNYIDDLQASTIQQIFVPACLPRSPNIQGRIDADPNEIISLYACEDCSEKFVLQSSLQFHKDRCSLVIKFKCRQCILDLVFYNRCNFLAHLRQHNLELNEEELSRLDVTTRPIPESMMPYFTIAEYHKENGPIITSNPQSSSACPECKVKLTISLREHFNRPITSEKDFNLSCKFCDLILPTKCCMKAHTRIHTKAGTLLCPDCCISFPIWESFWNHISNVCFHRHKVLRYECHKCTYIFKDREKLQEHFLSRHLPKLTRMADDGSNLEKAELNILKKCDLCYSAVPQWRMKSHILAHSKDRSALNVVYQCPYSSCYFCCSEYNLFKRHFTSCLHKSTNFEETPPNSTKEKKIANAPHRDLSELTDGGTKQALDILKSKGNIVVHRIDAKRTYQAHKPVASGGAFRSVVRMPLTPSPEPLSEGSGKGHCNEYGQRSSHASPKVKKSVPGPGKSVLATRLGGGSHELTHKDPVNEADVLVVKMHQCTICKELIAYDRKSDALKMHFKNKHRGKYKLGQIKRDLDDTVQSYSELTSDSDIDTDAAKHASLGISSRNGAYHEDSPPPLLKKQKPLAVSPRRLANANRKEVAASPRKSWEIVSVIDSDDECLLTLKNRAIELQSIGPPRSITNVKTRRKLPAGRSIDTEPGNVEKDCRSDSSSDSGPLYKRKRKRGSSSDPDFECRELIGYQPQLSDGLAVQRRRRTIDKKPAKTSDQDGEGRRNSPQKKLNGSLKKKISVPESKQKSPHNNDSKAYYSDVVNEYKTMGSGIVITTDQPKDNFQCLKPDCLFSSNDSEAFREHILTHRTDDNTFQCMECGICFVVKTTFAKHLIINHTINDVDAYIKENDCCDKEIIDKNINELERLEKRKTENVPTVLLENQCKICYKVCADPLSLNIHFRTHGMAFLRMNQQEKNK